LGADINVTSANGQTPLYFACAWGHTEIVKLLLDNGAVINITNEYGFTLLGIACKNGNKDIVNLLEEHIENQERE
jgi:ankyrin repeat protein